MHHNMEVNLASCIWLLILNLEMASIYLLTTYNMLSIVEREIRHPR